MSEKVEEMNIDDVEELRNYFEGGVSEELSELVSSIKKVNDGFLLNVSDL